MCLIRLSNSKTCIKYYFEKINFNNYELQKVAYKLNIQNYIHTGVFTFSEKLK